MIGKRQTSQILERWLKSSWRQLRYWNVQPSTSFTHLELEKNLSTFGVLFPNKVIFQRATNHGNRSPWMFEVVIGRLLDLHDSMCHVVWNSWDLRTFCELGKFGMDDIRIFVPVIDIDPHLPLEYQLQLKCQCSHLEYGITFRNVLNPAKILPPIQVLYFRSGGAKILMRISLTANL